jgi:hypothetical protein
VERLEAWIRLQRNTGFDALAQGVRSVEEEASAEHGRVVEFSVRNAHVPGQLAVGRAWPLRMTPEATVQAAATPYIFSAAGCQPG